MNGLMSQSLQGTQTGAVCGNVICTSLCQLLHCYSWITDPRLKILPRLSVKCLATHVLWEHITLNNLGARSGLASCCVLSQSYFSERRLDLLKPFYVT